jgi:hypothetical protein
MGGTGRNRGGSSLSVSDLYARAASTTDQAAYESETDSLLQDSLGDFNDRGTDAIHGHLDIIEDALSSDVEGTIELFFGGSLKKNTYVSGLSDVDMLVCLNDTTLESKSPAEVLELFEALLRERLPRTEIKRGDLAVTVKYSDGHEIQLLPAVKTATGFRIAQPKSGNWSNVVHPDSFAKRLSQVNQSAGGKVVPVIKLVKAMNDKLPAPLRLSGYHIESLAIDTFENYKGRTTLREMVRHFWQRTTNAVLHPVADTTGQSRHVDDYLGKDNGSERHQVSAAVGRIVNRIERAEALRSTDMWQELLEI